MIPNTGQTSTIADTPSKLKLRTRLCIVLGWALLACSCLRTASLGRIEADVRTFQMSFVVGAIGYLILLWIVTRCGRLGIHPGKWGWWLVGALVLRASLIAMEPSDDTYRYVWEGRVQLAGHNPYSIAPDDPQLEHLRDPQWGRINHPNYSAIYGPIAQLEFRLAAMLYPCIYTVKALHVVWDMLIVVLLGDVLRRTGRLPHLAMIYGLCPLVLTAYGIGGHVDSLMLLFLVLSVRAGAGEVCTGVAERMNLAGGEAALSPLAGAMLGLAIAVKIVPVVLLPWMILRHKRAAVVTVVVVCLCYLPFAGAGFDLFTSLRRFGSGHEFFSLLGTLHLTALGARPSTSWLAVVLLSAIAWKAWRTTSISRYYLGALEVLVLLMPIVHYWYATWVLVLVPFHLRLRWIVLSVLFVVSFETRLIAERTGVWFMPPWPKYVVWIPFLLIGGVELWIHSRTSNRVDRQPLRRNPAGVE